MTATEARAQAPARSHPENRHGRKAIAQPLAQGSSGHQGGSAGTGCPPPEAPLPAIAQKSEVPAQQASRAESTPTSAPE